MAKIDKKWEPTYFSFTWSELVEWCAGRLIISIGKGTFQSEMYTIASAIQEWTLHRKEINDAKGGR